MRRPRGDTSGVIARGGATQVCASITLSEAKQELVAVDKYYLRLMLPDDLVDSALNTILVPPCNAIIVPTRQAAGD